MPFKRARTNEDYLPPAERQESQDFDTEGQAARGKAREDEAVDAPAAREATDDGSSDTEGHAKINKF